MSPDRLPQHARYLFSIENAEADELEMHEEYVQKMLHEINTVLKRCPQNSRAYFLLFYGLTKHGRFTSKEIAEKYGTTFHEVMHCVDYAMDQMPSLAHRTFARRYFFTRYNF